MHDPRLENHTISGSSIKWMKVCTIEIGNTRMGGNNFQVDVFLANEKTGPAPPRLSWYCSFG